MTDKKTERGHYRHEALEDVLQLLEHMRSGRSWYSWRDLTRVIDRPENEASRKRIQRLMAVFVRLKKIKRETDSGRTFWKWNRI